MLGFQNRTPDVKIVKFHVNRDNIEEKLEPNELMPISVVKNGLWQPFSHREDAGLARTEAFPQH